MKTWRDAISWAPTTLIKDWARIRSMGRHGFFLRYGLLRVAPTLAAPLVGILIGQGLSLSWMRWAALVMLYVVIGLAWSLVTWGHCETRWQRLAQTDPAGG